MEIITYKLPLDHFLGQIEPFKTQGLPTDSLIWKEVPGCGATYWELLFKRNSIIIESHLPVIKGKCKKMNKGKRKNKVVLGVYEDVSVDDIRRHIKECKGYKKIMVTSESFWKVVEAIGDSIYTDYFMLFDECEKVIQDVEYRGGIIDPMDAFFRFTNKAFVSATPIIPSDPRFNNFIHVKIEPEYDYTQDITVLTTNNIIFQLKVILDYYEDSEANEGRKIFIFFKSTNRIRNIINGLKLKDYVVYCSDKSAKELKKNSINAYDQLNDTLTRYNFLTSRFFSAVDIDYDQYQCDPVIIMISDVLTVKHSVIDPLTEAIQICGRFRKPEKEKGKPEIKVTKDVYHVSNYNTKLTSFNETEIMAILDDKKRLHDFISTFKPTSDIEYFNQFIEEILQLNGFGFFLRKQDGKLNHFMVDNFKYSEQVNQYYKSSEALIDKYRTVVHFNVLVSSKYVQYNLTDKQLSEITDRTAYTTLNDFVSQGLRDIMNGSKINFLTNYEILMLRFNYPKQMEIVDEYGIENAKELDYDLNKIAQQLENAKGLKRLLPIVLYIKRMFEIGKSYSSVEIEEFLTVGIEESGLTDLHPDVKLLKNGALLTERKNIRKDERGNWIKGYEILGYVHNF